MTCKKPEYWIIDTVLESEPVPVCSESDLISEECEYYDCGVCRMQNHEVKG